MELIGQSLGYSILAKGWGGLIALLAVPFYAKIIGIEAYGIVGLFTSFSILIGFLDFGLGTTLARELARVPAKKINLAESRDFLRTFEIVYLLVAFLIVVLVTLSSTPIAYHWVQHQELKQSEIVNALSLAGVCLACQWPTNLYTSGLIGIQKQIPLAIATIFFSTIRVLITLAFIWLEPSLQSFFLGQILSALIQTFAIRSLLWRNLAQTCHKPKFNFEIIKSTLRFAGGMTGITITSVILTQLDKAILSKTLSLSDFGLYALIGSLATGLYMLISPVFSVMFPRFSSLVHQGDYVKLAHLYQTSSQFMALLIFPVVFLFSVFAQHVLYVWTGNEDLALNGAWILAMLMIGNGCNGVMNMPYALQLAFGRTKLAFLVNLGTIIMLVPIIWWAAVHYGAVGGATVWALLNVTVILLIPNFIHLSLLPEEKRRWYRIAVMLPLIVNACAFYLLHQMPISSASRINLALVLCIYWALTTIATLFFLPNLRKILLTKIRQI